MQKPPLEISIETVIEKVTDEGSSQVTYALP